MQLITLILNVLRYHRTEAWLLVDRLDTGERDVNPFVREDILGQDK